MVTDDVRAEWNRIDAAVVLTVDVLQIAKWVTVPQLPVAVVQVMSALVVAVLSVAPWAGNAAARPCLVYAVATPAIVVNT